MVEVDSGEIAPVWSPDGQLLLFTARENDRYDIGMMGVDGSNYMFLVQSPEGEFAPAWLTFE